MSEPVALASGRGRKVVVATSLGASLAFLDGSVVQVALPAIGEDLDASFSALQWVMDGYLLILAGGILVGGALGDRFGRRRVFVLGIIGFALASLACGLAPHPAALLLARAAQGITAALLIPGSLALLSSTFHGATRAEAIGAWSGVSALTTAGGPLMGGLIVHYASWRWVFLVNLPIAALCLALVRAAPESRTEGRRLELLGSALAVLGSAGLCFVLIEAPTRGWRPEVIAGLVVSILASVGWVLAEQRGWTRVVPTSLRRNPGFARANIITFTIYFALGGAIFVAALALQIGLGMTALRAGLMTLPMTLSLALLARQAGAWSTRFGARPLLVGGPLIAAGGLAALAAGAIVSAPALGLGVVGVGLGLVVAPLTAWVFGCVDDSDGGIASGINNAVARFAGLSAVAVLPAVSGFATAAEGPPLVRAGQVGLALSAMMMGLSAALAFFFVENSSAPRRIGSS